jgi:error-prone DNA polymerase
VLGKTLGVPLFQEQAMQVAIVCAGFTPTEADQLRRSMATFKFQGEVSAFRDKLVAGMLERGYRRDFAEQIFRQIEGFGSYGFPESHAASFALIAYASSWLKCHHPDAFAAALLNARPMGFYAPAQVVRDARAHGVEVRPVSVNASRWECTLEPASGKFLALRLGLSFVKGLGVEDAADLVAARGEGTFASAADLARRTGLAREALEHLAEADAFAPLGQDRRAALWDISAIAAAPLPLFAAAGEAREPAVALAPLPEGGEIVEDYRSSGLTLRRHPLALLRDDLLSKRIRPCTGLGELRDGARAAIAGLILVRQRPGSAGGVTFVTLEDESGFANVVVWARLFEAQRRVLLGASLIACHGRVQREGSVIHLIAERLEDLSPLLAGLGTRGAGIAAPGETLKVTTRDFR